MSCTSAAECTEVVNGNSVLKVCYDNPDFSEETSFCDCDALLGFVGEECNESSSHEEFLRLVSFLFTFILLGLIMWSIWAFYQLNLKYADLHKTVVNNRKVTRFRILPCLGFTFLAILGITIDRILVLQFLFTQTGLEISKRVFAIDGEQEAILPKTQTIQDIAVSTSFYTTILAVSYLSLYFKELTVTSRTERLNWNRVTFQFSLIILVYLVVVELNGLKLNAVVSIVEGSLALFVLLTFIPTTREFVGILHSMKSTTKNESSAFVLLINRTYYLITIFGLVFAIESILYGITLRFSYSLVQPGEIHYVSIFKVIQVSSLLIIITTVLVFNTKVLNNPSLAYDEESREETAQKVENRTEYFNRRNSLTSPHAGVGGSVTILTKGGKKNKRTTVHKEATEKPARRHSLTNPQQRDEPLSSLGIIRPKT